MLVYFAESHFPPDIPAPHPTPHPRYTPCYAPLSCVHTTLSPLLCVLAPWTQALMESLGHTQALVVAVEFAPVMEPDNPNATVGSPLGASQNTSQVTPVVSVRLGGRRDDAAEWMDVTVTQTEEAIALQFGWISFLHNTTADNYTYDTRCEFLQRHPISHQHPPYLTGPVDYGNWSTEGCEPRRNSQGQVCDTVGSVHPSACVWAVPSALLRCGDLETTLQTSPPSHAVWVGHRRMGGGGGGGGAANAFFLHLFCLQFPLIVAIHGQVCVTCTILTGVGGGCNCIYLLFFCIAFFAVSTCTPPPPCAQHLAFPPRSGPLGQRRFDLGSTGGWVTALQPPPGPLRVKTREGGGGAKKAQ